MADASELSERIQAGVGLITAALGTDPETGAVDRATLAAMLGEQPSQDDLIDGLSNVLLVSQMILMMHWKATGKEPRALLREISVHQERFRGND